MGRPKSNNVQINISIPMEWKTELENLARLRVPHHTLSEMNSQN